MVISKQLTVASLEKMPWLNFIELTFFMIEFYSLLWLGVDDWPLQTEQMFTLGPPGGLKEEDHLNSMMCQSLGFIDGISSGLMIRILEETRLEKGDLSIPDKAWHDVVYQIHLSMQRFCVQKTCNKHILVTVNVRTWASVLYGSGNHEIKVGKRHTGYCSGG